MMGDTQSVDETNAPASPRSPTSPRVVPVDGDETSMPAVQSKDASRGDEEALSPKSSGTVTLHNNDDDDAASPVQDEPGRAASQRSSGRRGDRSNDRCEETRSPDSNESRAPARTLVLKGHAREIICLAALDGGRLASGYSGSMDESIIIWNLADGAQIAKLEGHTNVVYCLAALDGDRLASGSLDNSVIIWNLADGTQQATLDNGTHVVMSLAALDGNRLALGRDISIIIWNVADGAQLTKLEGHTSYVQCLAKLPDDQLASGRGGYGRDMRDKKDNSIIIWNLADGTQLARLEGHKNDVKCLAELDGGRLASGSLDGSIIIWNVADGAQLAKLEGHEYGVTCLAALDGNRLASSLDYNTIRIWNVAVDVAGGEAPVVMWGQSSRITCLAALNDGRLASGGRDCSVRVRPVRDSSAALRIAECGSAFEFEEVARACRKNNALEDLLDAVDGHLDQNKSDASPESASQAVSFQAQVFDAIAKVVNEEKDAPREKLIDSLAPRVLSLVRDDDLLPDMKRDGVSNAAIQELAPSPLFRVVLDAKFAAGPVFVLYFELFLFIVLGLCFTRVAAFEVLDVSKWFAAEKVIEIVVAFAILAYFSAREIYQMASTRTIELATLDGPLSDAEGLAFYALLIPRMLLGLVVCLPILPVILVVIGLKCAGKDYKWMGAFDKWFGKNIFDPILHDPLTFLGLPRAWRGDYWNWIDASTIGCAWAAFARAAMPGGRLSADLAVATAILMWIRFCWYLKNLRLGWAKFVLMIEQIAWDLREYLLFFLVVLLMFASAFYLYIGPRKSAEFGFHDDGAPNAYRNFGYTVYNLILLGFVGDFDADNFDKVVLRVLLVFYIIVVIVIFLNVLIAIVSDSYDLSMAKAEGLYLRSRLELITETAPIASRLPTWMLPDYDADETDYRRGVTTKHAKLNKMITDTLDEAKKDKADDPNRLNYTINAVEAIVENRSQRTEQNLRAELTATRENMEAKIDAMEKKIDKLTAMIQTLLDNQQP